MSSTYTFHLPTYQAKLTKGHKNDSFIERQWMVADLTGLNTWTYSPMTNYGNPTVSLHEERQMLGRETIRNRKSSASHHDISGKYTQDYLHKRRNG